MTAFSFSNPSSFQYRSRTVAIVAFPGVEALDITGPMEVFSFANLGLMRQGVCSEKVYRIKLLAAKAGPVTTMSGLQIVADQAYADCDEEVDILLIPGGNVEAEVQNRVFLDWIAAMSSKVDRLAAVCTGSFLLAEAGLLDGCQATTHWDYCQKLAKTYPEVTVKPDRIFIQDGKIFTSGGITSGIDLALSILEDDWGRDLALYVARFLVVFLKRPGGQSQFSAYLSNEACHRKDLRELQSWIMAHLDHDLRVEFLADRMAMSPRHFARLFQEETGITPAKFVEMARIDHARHLLETTEQSIDWIAEKSGFFDPERMRRSFLRQLGVNPLHYRQRFSRANTED